MNCTSISPALAGCPRLAISGCRAMPHELTETHRSRPSGLEWGPWPCPQMTPKGSSNHPSPCLSLTPSTHLWGGCSQGVGVLTEGLRYSQTCWDALMGVGVLSEVLRCSQGCWGALWGVGVFSEVLGALRDVEDSQRCSGALGGVRVPDAPASWRERGPP